jgi:NitT/TauT family transport system substrate-binding protein
MIFKETSRMKKTIKNYIAVLTLVFLASPLCVFAEKKDFKIAWSHYTGWEAWAYAEHAGLLKKWGDKYGITIKLDLINDYIESINLYTAGTYDGCVMTNMDALTIPAVGGIDSSAIIVGDFSNGNDGVVTKQGNAVADLKSQTIKLVELSVSHYLLSRALAINGLTERDVKLVNTSDADIGAAFLADAKGAAVTWNPILMQIRNAKGANLVFDSSKIPGEIIDLMVVKTDSPEALKKALAGAWYEAMSIISGSSKESDESIVFMAKNSGGTPAEFRAQLKTTRMFYSAEEASKFAASADLKKTMDYVRNFSFEHGLYGDGAKTKDVIGIELGDKSTIGDGKNIKLRFPTEYMQLAADKKL